MTTPHDDFYVGYLRMPSRVKRFAVGVVGLLFIVAIAVGIVIASQQRTPGTGEWEADNESTIEGTYLGHPYPMLVTDDGTYLLVSVGKRGAWHRFSMYTGYTMRLTGTKLQREGRRMFEIADGERGINIITHESKPVPPGVAIGQVTVQGEIIDPKCYLGAMKPGGGKTHKACAALCLRGGIPPMFVIRHAGGGETFYLLTTADGGPILDDVLPFVGDPVELSGHVFQHGDLVQLRVNVTSIKRL